MWRSRIFWRLFGAYSLLLTVSFGLLGWLLIDRMERHLLQEIQHGLEVKTLLLRDLVNRTGEAELQEQVLRVAQEADARITLIHANGKVLADSGEKLDRIENHLDRVEVQQAEAL